MKALQIKNLKKTYKNGFQALKGIDLEINEGDFFALLGPNGAGKSTTIGIVTSLVNKTNGEVNIFGLNIDSHSIEAKSLIGFTPQEVNFSQFESPLEILINQAGYYGINRKMAYERAEEHMVDMGLWEKRNDPSRTLSGGLKQRLMMARALMHKPKLLILDEPTAGVDVELRRLIWDFLIKINEQGTTIVLTTHYLEEAENLCRNIAIIDKGNIIENTSMKLILSKLDIETFIFYIKQNQSTTPNINGYDYRMLDDSTLQINISKQRSINNLFKQLSEQKIEVLSMRNKSNRLEELFIRLLEGNKSNS